MTLKQRLKRLLARLTSFIPTPLPRGYEEHKRWATSILELASIPDNDSTRFALAVMIMHCASTENNKPKYFFVKQLEKAAANEIAANIGQEYKHKQQQRQELASIKKSQEDRMAEATRNKEVASGPVLQGSKV